MVYNSSGRWSTVVIKGWIQSATILRSAVMFKQCSLGTKGPKVCQQPPLHTTRQDGSMLSCYLFQILMQLSE